MAEMTCPECGAALPEGAPEAPCAACLMNLGMQSWARKRESSAVGGNGEGPTATPPRITAPSPAELAPHFSQLEILELLGQGGMGAVYKARQKSLDRIVALKIINPDEANDPGFAGRFEREAKALARLNHPHIVHIHDFGEAEGLYFFVMEFVDGVDLRALISAGKLQPSEALALVPQICDALQYAHEEGIVHRDIKPENILVDKRGRVKIADFGLAKMLRLSAVERTITHTQHVVGTFHYMAPEQFERPGEIDHRVDIFALGVVFYEMLTGTLPVGRFDLPSQRCGTDARLDQVVLKALEREPDRRYQHASDVKTDVEAVGAAPQKPPRSSPAIPAAAETEAVAAVEAARDELAVPAIALIVYGALALISAAIGLAMLSYFEIVDDSLHHETIAAFLAMTLGGGLLGALVLATGVKMRKLDNYDFVVAGSIITLLTLFSLYTAIAAIPLGIWCLSLLRRRDVRRAFALQQQLWRADPEMAEQLALQRKLAGPAWGLIAAGLASLLTPIVVVLFSEGNDKFENSPILFSLLPGALMLAGGVAMLRHGPYELAMYGAWAGMLPCSPVWPLTLAAGYWAYSTLEKPHIKERFTRWSEEEPASGPAPSESKPAETDADLIAARDSVAAPAMLLIATGILAAVAAVGVVVFALISIAVAMSGVDVAGIVFVWPIAAAVPAAIVAPVLIIGGLQMKRLESRGVAFTAAIVALLPIYIAWPLGLPAGAWTLAVLSRGAVARAFREQQVRWDAWEASIGRTSVLLIVSAVLHVFLLAPFWVMYVVDPPLGQIRESVTVYLSIATGVIALTSLTMLIGAVQMRSMQSRGWGLAAGVAALLPVSPAVLLSLPTGLCALSLLTRPGVEEWFATPAGKDTV